MQRIINTRQISIAIETFTNASDNYSLVPRVKRLRRDWKTRMDARIVHWNPRRGNTCPMQDKNTADIRMLQRVLHSPTFVQCDKSFERASLKYPSDIEILYWTDSIVSRFY